MPRSYPDFHLKIYLFMKVVWLCQDLILTSTWKYIYLWRWCDYAKILSRLPPENLSIYEGGVIMPRSYPDFHLKIYLFMKVVLLCQDLILTSTWKSIYLWRWCYYAKKLPWLPPENLSIYEGGVIMPRSYPDFHLKIHRFMKVVWLCQDLILTSTWKYIYLWRWCNYAKILPRLPPENLSIYEGGVIMPRSYPDFHLKIYLFMKVVWLC